MEIGRKVQAIIKFGLSNLKCCNVGITAEGDLQCTQFKWAEVARYTYQVM
jgi:hypothetical protein